MCPQQHMRIGSTDIAMSMSKYYGVASFRGFTTAAG